MSYTGGKNAAWQRLEGVCTVTEINEKDRLHQGRQGAVLADRSAIRDVAGMMRESQSSTSKA